MIAQNGKLPGIQLREKKGLGFDACIEFKTAQVQYSNQQSKLKQVYFNSLFTGFIQASMSKINNFQGLRVNEKY